MRIGFRERCENDRARAQETAAAVSAQAISSAAMTPDPRYPIGKFEMPATVSDAMRKQWIDEIADTPGLLRAAVRGLNAEQLDTPYREGGWNPRQVVHHLSDSHVNAYCRTKFALTETNPTIKPYDENAWSELEDVKIVPIETSLTLLDALHSRWVALLRTLGAKDWARTFFHPEKQATQTLDRLLALYAWHGKSHTAHITSLRARMKW